MVKGTSFFIGIIPTVNIMSNARVALTNPDFKGSIAYYSGGYISNNIQQSAHRLKKYGDESDNDVISVILDFSHCKVSFLKNGKKQGSMRIEGNISYSFGVSIKQGHVQYVQIE